MRAQKVLERRVTDASRRWALPITAGSGFLAGLDTTAVNLALPDIQRDSRAGSSGTQWVVNAFALASAALLVTAGSLSDRLGRRRVFVAGLVAFAAASAACGLAPSALVLDMARAVQGASSAVVTAGGLAVLASLYPPGSGGVRSALTPRSGRCPSSSVRSWAARSPTSSDGDRCSWSTSRSLFSSPWRLGSPCPDSPRARRPASGRGLTSPGRTFALGLGALLYAALRGGETGWWHGEVVVAAALGVAGLGAFVLLERRTSDGLIDLGLFRDRTSAGATAAMALVAGAYFGMLVYLSLYLQGTQGLDALEAGLVYLPTIAPYMAMSPLAGRLMTRFPGRRVPTTGLALVTVGMLLLIVGVHAEGGLPGSLPGWWSPASGAASR